MPAAASLRILRLQDLAEVRHTACHQPSVRQPVSISLLGLLLVQWVEEAQQAGRLCRVAHGEHHLPPRQPGARGGGAQSQARRSLAASLGLHPGQLAECGEGAGCYSQSQATSCRTASQVRALVNSIVPRIGDNLLDNDACWCLLQG